MTNEELEKKLGGLDAKIGALMDSIGLMLGQVVLANARVEVLLELKRREIVQAGSKPEEVVRFFDALLAEKAQLIHAEYKNHKPPSPDSSPPGESSAANN